MAVGQICRIEECQLNKFLQRTKCIHQAEGFVAFCLGALHRDELWCTMVQWYLLVTCELPPAIAS